jgi:hypothetical protein
LSSGIFFVLIWFAMGAVVIRKTSTQLHEWRNYEKTVLDADYLKGRKL